MNICAPNDPSGHRRRLRERFHMARAEGMHDYEILELLLTYTIPRKDVKPIAKDLLRRFGSLSSVLDASPNELIQIPHIRLSGATLLKLVKEISGFYLSERMRRRNVLTNPRCVVDFATMKLAGLPHEAFMVIFLNVQNELLNHTIINEGTVDQVAVYPRRIVELGLQHHAAGLLLVHNHPSGYTAPSEEDKRLTRTLGEICRVMDMRILDHIIVGKAGYFSFQENGLV